MPSLLDIRTGFVEMLAALQDSGGSPQVDMYSTDVINIPTIRILRPELIGFDVAMQGGGDTYDWIIQALVGVVDDVNAQIVLDAWIGRGTGTVKTAIEAKDANGDRSLGGRVDDTWVRECTGYRVYNVGGVEVFGAEWTVQVETTD